MLKMLKIQILKNIITYKKTSFYSSKIKPFKTFSLLISDEK